MVVNQLAETDFKWAGEVISAAKEEIGHFIVGQKHVVEEVVWGMIAEGHVLLEGLPGLGKTVLVKTISDVMDLSFSRIQFTPDLMPSDITGTMMFQPDENGKSSFVFHKGPLFSNLILADEINRATPKTQSALLEAMGEKTVTVLGETHRMDAPFFVLATQNPIEMEGTYPLPEAQLDRFICHVHVPYPTKSELKEIIKRTTAGTSVTLQKKLGKEDFMKIQQLAKAILIADEVLDYAVDLVAATHPGEDAHEDIVQYVQFGSGPRGLQSLIRMAKARALTEGRLHVSKGDIKHVARPTLRHRLLVNFEAEASGVSADDLIGKLLNEGIKE